MFLSIGDEQLKEVAEKILGERVKPEKIMEIAIFAEKVNKLICCCFCYDNYHYIIIIRKTKVLTSIT